MGANGTRLADNDGLAVDAALTSSRYELPFDDTSARLRCPVIH